MIQSFTDEATEAIWEERVTRSLPTDIQRSARRKLTAAQNVQDLSSPPGNHLEALLRDRKGKRSIRINDLKRSILCCSMNFASSVVKIFNLNRFKHGRLETDPPAKPYFRCQRS